MCIRDSPSVGRCNEYRRWFRSPLGKKRRVLRSSGLGFPRMLASRTLDLLPPDWRNAQRFDFSSSVSGKRRSWKYAAGLNSSSFSRNWLEKASKRKVEVDSNRKRTWFCLETSRFFKQNRFVYITHRTFNASYRISVLVAHVSLKENLISLTAFNTIYL